MIGGLARGRARWAGRGLEFRGFRGFRGFRDPGSGTRLEAGAMRVSAVSAVSAIMAIAEIRETARSGRGLVRGFQVCFRGFRDRPTAEIAETAEAADRAAGACLLGGWYFGQIP